MGAEPAEAPAVGAAPARPVFPSTRYQGSKARLAEWIWAQLRSLDFDTALDAFGGTAAVAWRLRREGKQVTYNDALRFNHQIGLALVQNDRVRLEPRVVEQLLGVRNSVQYPRLVQDEFAGIYYTDDENAWIDRVVTNVAALRGRYERALASFALYQACLVKRPYNLFHRRNLYLRFADVKRSFGNKASWDRPFEAWFRRFAAEANRAVFSNGRRNRATNLNAVDVPGEYDLVYLDPPYLGKRGTAVDYLGFYHFLEGLASYDDWAARIDRTSRHRRLRAGPPRGASGNAWPGSAWTARGQVRAAFERLFERFAGSILVVSYRSDGALSAQELKALLARHGCAVRVARHPRQYALSKNAASEELLMIGTRRR